MTWGTPNRWLATSAHMRFVLSSWVTGGQHIALFHAGTDEHVLVEAHALHGAAVEVAAEVREGIGVLVDAADVVAVVREHIGQLRPHAPAPDHNHVAHSLPLSYSLSRAL